MIPSLIRVHVEAQNPSSPAHLLSNEDPPCELPSSPLSLLPSPRFPSHDGGEQVTDATPQTSQTLDLEPPQLQAEPSHSTPKIDSTTLARGTVVDLGELDLDVEPETHAQPWWSVCCVSTTVISLLIFFCLNYTWGLYLLVSMTPTAVGLYLLYWRKHRDRVQVQLVVEMFWTGFFLALPVVLVGVLIGQALPKRSEDSSVALQFVVATVSAFVMAAFIEESFKYAAVKRLTKGPDTTWMRHCSNPYAVVICACIAALGFATIENVLYVVWSSDALAVGAVRAVLAVPGHTAWGGIHGSNVARQLFWGESRPYYKVIWTPVILHGAYNWFLMVGSIGYKDSEETGSATTIAGFCGTLLVFVLGCVWSRRQALDIFNRGGGSPPHRREVALHPKGAVVDSEIERVKKLPLEFRPPLKDGWGANFVVKVQT